MVDYSHSFMFLLQEQNKLKHYGILCKFAYKVIEMYIELLYNYFVHIIYLRIIVYYCLYVEGNAKYSQTFLKFVSVQETGV